VSGRRASFVDHEGSNIASWRRSVWLPQADAPVHGSAEKKSDWSVRVMVKPYGTDRLEMTFQKAPNASATVLYSRVSRVEPSVIEERRTHRRVPESNVSICSKSQHTGQGVPIRCGGMNTPADSCITTLSRNHRCSIQARWSSQSHERVRIGVYLSGPNLITGHRRRFTR
jgi:hypothetical protein